MDLSYPVETEPFRAEIRKWLTDNLPEGWGSPGFSMTGDEKRTFNREWTKKLFAGGWICASWPKEYGGKGLSLMESVVLNEEFARAEAPLRADFFGDTLVGPTILQWATEDQKQQFIPGILNGTISWCQGFSDPDAPKHAGTSYLLVPMKQPGIEVRPIAQVDGSADFNEIFFTNARCPRQNVVGGENNGWKVAMTTLGFERGSSATTGHRRFARELDQIIATAQKNGRSTDPQIRQRLATSWTKVKIMEINGYRSLTDSLNGTHHM